MQLGHAAETLHSTIMSLLKSAMVSVFAIESLLVLYQVRTGAEAGQASSTQRTTARCSSPGHPQLVS